MCAFFPGTWGEFHDAVEEKEEVGEEEKQKKVEKKNLIPEVEYSHNCPETTKEVYIHSVIERILM